MIPKTLIIIMILNFHIVPSLVYSSVNIVNQQLYHVVSRPEAKWGDLNVPFLSAGHHGLRAQRLREYVAGAGWEYLRLHRHPRPAGHHQLPARFTVQIQLQLPAGVPGQQLTAGLVSLGPRNPSGSWIPTEFIHVHLDLDLLLTLIYHVPGLCG